MTSPATVFGIDLGTTYSCLAYVDEVGKPVVVPTEDNDLVTPSVVYFESASNVIVGKIAKETARVYPENVVELIKRSMGDPNYRRLIHGQEYRPEDVSALILKKLKADAERHLGHAVTQAVITVPAYFNEARRTATEQAGALAGLTVRGIIPEPTAAAIAYAVTHRGRQTVLVFDLGGGTFDVTVMEVHDGNVRVVCIGGDHELGGRNWDEVLVGHFADEWRRQTGRGEDPLDEMETAQAFLTLAEDAKRRLSRVARTPVSLSHGGERARVELTRERFDELTAGRLEHTIALTRDTLEEARRRGVAAVDRLILVGGSSYMPQVSARLLEAFGLHGELFDPDQCVAKGAAIYAGNRAIQDTYAAVLRDLFGPGQADAALLEDSDLGDFTLDLLPDPRGAGGGEDAGGELDDGILLPPLDIAQAPPLELLPENVRGRVLEEMAGRLPALRAADIEAGVRRQIVNASSKNFGVVALNEREAEQVFYLIRKNSQVPATVADDFGTVEDGQESVLIRIIESESDDATDPASPACKEIKTGTLTLSPGLPRGSVIVVRYFLSDDGGRLRVTATEQQTGRSVDVDVVTVDALTPLEMRQKRDRLLKTTVQG